MFGKFEDQQKEAKEGMDGCMQFTHEWFEEDLPMENKEGTSMDQLVQAMLDQGPLSYLEKTILEQEGKPWPEKHSIQLPKNPPAAPQERILVFSDSEGVCEAVLKRAPQGRVGATKYLPKLDYTREELKKVLTEKWDLIIFGSAVTPPASNSVADVIQHNAELSKLYLFVLQEIQANEGCAKRMAVITRGCMAIEEGIHKEGGLGLISGGTLYGMTNTARLELATEKDFPIQFIDTEYDFEDLCSRWGRLDLTELVHRISAEIFRHQSFGHNTVRLMESGRYVMRCMTQKGYAMAKQKFELPSEGSDGIIAISGGNGALALLMGNYLLDRAKDQKKQRRVVY